MLTADQAKKLAEKVRNGQIADDDLDEAGKMLDEFRASNGIAAPKGPRDITGESGSFLSPMVQSKSLDEAIPEREAAPGTGQSYTEVPNAVTKIQWDPMDEAHAKAYNAHGPARPGEPALPPTADTSAGAAEGRQAHEKWFQTLKRPELKSASQMPDIYADPVYVPKPSIQSDPHLGSLSPLDQAAAHIKAAKDATPETEGGNLRYHYEPTLKDFQADMFPVLGPSVMDLGEDSEQFKQYADTLYKRERDRAVAQGKGIVRVAYADMTPSDRAAAERADSEAALGGSIPIAGKLATRANALLTGEPGNEAVERVERAGNRHPVTSTIGSFIMPVPGGGAATGLARVGKTVATGAGLAAGATAGDEALGSAPTSAGSIGEHALDAGMTGGLLGLGFGGLGELAGAARPGGEKLGALRDVGGDTSVWHGVDPGPHIGRVQAEVKGLGFPGTELPHTIEKARPAVTKTLLTEEAKANFEHGAARNATEEALAKNRNPATELFETVDRATQKQYGADNLPLAEAPRRRLQEIRRLVSKVTPANARRELVKVVGPGEDAIVEKVKAEYGEDAPEKIKKAYWEQRGKEFDKNAVPLASAADREATNPGGRPKTPVSGEAPTAPAPSPSQAPTEPDVGENLNTLSEGEDAEIAERAGTHANPINAAKYGLKRQVVKATGKSPVQTPEGPQMAREPVQADVLKAKDARGAGIDIDPSVPDDAMVVVRKTNQAPKGAKRMYAGEARAAGYDVPKTAGDHDLLYVEPRKVSPGELYQLEQNIHDLKKTGAVPYIDEIEKAAKQVRDTYPEAGPAKGARATIEDLATGKTTELKGLSALQHNESEAMAKRALTRQRTGIPESGNADPAAAFRNATVRSDVSPAEIADRKAAWERAGQGDAFKLVEGLKAYKDLSGKHLSPNLGLAAARGHVPYHLGNLEALQLHLDPILAGKYTPSAGRLAAVGGNRFRGAPKVTFDYINRLLSPNPEGP